MSQQTLHLLPQFVGTAVGEIQVTWISACPPTPLTPDDIHEPSHRHHQLLCDPTPLYTTSLHSTPLHSTLEATLSTVKYAVKCSQVASDSDTDTAQWICISCIACANANITALTISISITNSISISLTIAWHRRLDIHNPWEEK
ncbi:hypothetical protein TcWFU_004358 [Taenia crassiceps]|uniref:Uncharacterized protein n=1 Tax=Taenia crassiceps TaxID=6207 RepID=A0ABR4Q1S3_9CEST